MANAAARLEQLLRMHEDNCFAVYMMQKTFDAVGLPMGPSVARMWTAIQSSSKLRSDLAKIKPQLGWDETKTYLENHGNIGERKFNEIPVLGMWVSHSRRVFKLSHDLQTLLDATSLDDVAWRDVCFPFDGFAVSLAQSIVLDPNDLNIEYDTILVARDSKVQSDKETYLYLVLLPRAMEGLSFFSATERRKIQEMLKRRRYDKVKKLTNRYLPYGSQTSTMIVYCRVTRDMTITQDLTVDKNSYSLTEKGVAVPQRALRIVAGMCLYLKSLPSGSRHISAWEKIDEWIPTDRGNCVTDKAEVCHVSTQFKLSSREREIYERHTEEVMGTPGGTLSPHFRRGHWRRQRGLGKDPTAPKTEWVRPTIVNEHLLQEGELPKGASTVLLT